MMPDIHIITGPTASGKTALSLTLAQQRPSVIINADSLQLYRDLPILTAQPTQEERGQTPHLLFGVLEPETRVSAVWWARQAMEMIRAATQAGQRVILVGGTGLYLKILQEGIAPVPDIAPATLQKATDEMWADPEGVWAQLNAADTAEGARLQTLNPMRLARAWAVFQETGKTLSQFWAAPPERFLETPAHVHIVDIERPALRMRIAQRFEIMLDKGAIEEVEALMVQNMGPEAPIWRALGAIEIRDFLEGRLTREAMIQRTVERSCQYAKRQVTWMRHQMEKKS